MILMGNNNATSSAPLVKTQLYRPNTTTTATTPALSRRSYAVSVFLSLLLVPTPKNIPATNFGGSVAAAAPLRNRRIRSK